jgi:DNA mismatch endonuclease, patch repair protein
MSLCPCGYLYARGWLPHCEMNMETALRKMLTAGRFRNVPPKRSAMMAAVRAKGNKSTELRLRYALVRAGIRGWVIHAGDIPGRPDFYFERARLAVFVDGCFWHHCKICGHLPRTNNRFWREKLRLNSERDTRTTKRLRKSGIAVLRLWEHELFDTKQCVNRISRRLLVRSVRNHC